MDLNIANEQDAVRGFEVADLRMSRGVLKKIKLEEILAAHAQHESSMEHAGMHEKRFVTHHRAGDGVEFQAVTDREQGITSICLDTEEPGI